MNKIVRIITTTILGLLVVTGWAASTGWGEAKWIGTKAEDQPLYSHYLAVFRLRATIEIARGSERASLVYGANDDRLMNTNLNTMGMEARRGKTLIRVELRLVADSACIDVWRLGYAPTDSQDKPLKTIGISRKIVTRANTHAPHQLEIASCLGDTRLSVDGKEVGRLNLNPIGRGGDFIAYPVLGDVGVSVDKGQKAVFSDVAVYNYRSPRGLVARLSHIEGSVKGQTIVGNPSRNAMPMLRTRFDLSKPVSRATLCITARGIYDAYVNGRRVTESYLSPGYTQYNKTHVYQTIDVTQDLRRGANVVGAQLAEGWWMGAATYQGENWNYFGDRLSLLCKLDITYADGTHHTIVSKPETWRYTTEGAVVAGSLFQGEVYDARKEAALAGWSKATFDDRGWTQAVEIPTEGHISNEGWGNAPAPDDYTNWSLTAEEGDAVDSVMTLKAVGMTEPRPGVWVYDMGQNMVGVPRITLRQQPEGKTMRLRFAEVTYPSLPRYRGQEGMLMLENIRAAMAQDLYTTKGGNETFAPRYSTHGYRYVEISGLDTPPKLEDVEGVVLSSAKQITAHYETSDTMVNRLWENIVWSTRGNFVSIPTDCPQRNERLGWMGDISVYAPTATYLTHAQPLLRRYLKSMRDVQHEDGRMPDVAPLGGGFGGLLWGSASITLPWEMYRQWGDTASLSSHYSAMKRYVDYVMSHYINPSTGIIEQEHQWGDLGDWLSPVYDQDDKSLIWECYLIHDLDIMAATAGVLNLKTDSIDFATLAKQRRAFFNATYLQPDTYKTIGSSFVASRAGKPIDTQISYVLPLAFDVVEGEARSQMIKNLLTVVERENRMDNGETAPGNSLLTGFIGTSWISRVLSQCGHTDVAYRLLLQRSYPSWLYPVSQGATTIWERLNSYTHKDGFGGNNRMNSFNHYSFGAVGYWLMAHSLGIRRDSERPGFTHFVLAPEPDPTGHLTYARGWYDSELGRIESSWEKRDGQTSYRFVVPRGTTATIEIAGRKAIEVGPGTYHF